MQISPQSSVAMAIRNWAASLQAAAFLLLFIWKTNTWREHDHTTLRRDGDTRVIAPWWCIMKPCWLLRLLLLLHSEPASAQWRAFPGCLCFKVGTDCLICKGTDHFISHSARPLAGWTPLSTLRWRCSGESGLFAGHKPLKYDFKRPENEPSVLSQEMATLYGGCKCFWLHDF